MSSQETSGTPGSKGVAWASWVSPVLLSLLGALLLGPVWSAGLWDPPELTGAELGRRIALNLYGAEAFVVEGASNTLPSVEEVKRGELPFLLVGLGFRVFGLHDWAGRLPLALFAFAGALSVYWMCRRLSSVKHGLLTVLVMTTAPVFFAQARSMLGDAATMACSALVFSGFMLACFDRLASLPLRLAYLVGGLLGAFGGLYCRGALIGVAAPALAVGLTWVLVSVRTGHAASTASRQGSDKADSLAARYGRFAVGALILLLAGVATVWGTAAAFEATKSDYLVALGTAVDAPKQYPTHDFLILHLGHAFFPWSAFLPVAFGLALTQPAQRGEKGRSELALKAASILAAGLVLGAHTLLAPKVGLIPFSAVYALASIVAFGLLDWDRKPAGAPAAALAVAAFAIVLFADFRHFPDKVLSPFALSKATLPPNFEDTTKWTFALVTAPIVLATALLAVERWSWIGRVIDWLGRLTHSSARSLIAGVGLAAAAVALSVGYYPALAAQVSPVGAFDEFERLAEPGEPLATTGKGGNASAYYASVERQHFDSDRQALEWLLDGAGQRRWLILKGSDLASINSSYRRSSGGKNLPVLGQSSGAVLLVSNQLKAGEKDKNPLSRYLPEQKPEPARTLQAEFGDKLKVLGWEIRDPSTGQVVEKLKRGRSYRIHLYYEVLRRITQNWKTFVHIDGPSSRINADHDPLDDKYPFRHWNKGDYIADDYVFDLEPDAVPGPHTVYFGFYSGKSRLDVTKGGDKDDRVDGGMIVVE